MKKLLRSGLLAARYSLLATAAAASAAFAQVSDVPHSTALEAGHVLKASRGTLLSLHGYNSKASAQFIQIHDAAAVPSDLVAGVAEISTVTTTGYNVAGVAEVFTVDFAGKVPAELADKYLLTEDADGSVYVWFNLDAAGVDPAPAGVDRGIPVAIATGDTAAQLATKAAAALEADDKFAAAAVDTLVTVTNSETGARTDAAAGDSALTVLTTVVGVTAITAADLNEKYFTTADASGPVHVWFNVGAAGTDPAPAGSRPIEVALVGNETDPQIAAAIAAGVDPDAAFACAAVDDVATITNAATGARTNIAAGDSTLTVAVTQQGVTAIAASAPLLVITVPATSNFTLELPATGLPCSSGIVVCNSSTAATKTAGLADCYFTATVR